MFCKNCGKELNENESFCGECGTKVVPETQNVGNIENTNNNPINEPKSQTYNVNNISSTQENKKDDMKGLKVASLVLGIIAVVFSFFINLFILPFAIISLTLGIIYSVKKKRICAGIILSVVSIIISIAMIFVISFFAYFSAMNTVPLEDSINKVSKINDELSNSLENDKNNYYNNNLNNEINSKYSTGYKYVGSASYGYIKVPNDFAKFVDVDGNSTIQYSNTSWIVTIYSPSDTSITPYIYSRNVVSLMKEEGVEQINRSYESVTSNKYLANYVEGFYKNENKWLKCWIFKDDSGKVHYISIEGPDKENDYYDLVNTFVSEK